MKVSVVVPTFARPRAIERCVAALQRQNLDALEILVVDDGSPEPIGVLPDGPHPVRVLRQSNAGPAAARNAGAAAAEGDLVCFTDDDCRPAPGWAAAFAAAAVNHDGLLAGTTRNAVRGNVFSAASQDMADYVARLGPGAAFAQSNNVAIRRASFRRVGGFPRGFKRAAGEDRAFSHACASIWPEIARVSEAVVDHDHELTLASFWRQHRNYGHGAFTWHRLARERSTATFSRPAFYLGLVGEPLRNGITAAGVARAALIAASQVATAQGYAEAARDAQQNGILA